MRTKVSAYLNTLITIVVLAVAGITPLLFIPLTTEFYEIPKIIFLISAVLILLILWALSWVIDGKVTFTRTPLDIPLLLLLAVVVVSTVVSETKYISIYGAFPRIHGSAATWVAYILFYFITVSHLRTEIHIKALFYTVLGSSIVIALISLFSYFGVYLPLPFAQVPNFTPTGSSFSTVALLLLVLPFVLLSIVKPNKFLQTPIAMVITILFTLTIALIGTSNATDVGVLFSPALIILYLIFGLIFFVTNGQSRNKLIFLLVPLGVMFAVLLFSFLPLGQNNTLANKRNAFPREVQLPFASSWKVAASTFRDTPFLGTGPSTFGFNFTSYKPAEFNLDKYWNVRFDTATNEYLETLSTLGGLGFLAFLFLTAVILTSSWGALAKKNNNNLITSLSISAIVAIGLFLIHVSTPVMIITTIAMLAMLMAVYKSTNGKVEELTLGIKASKITDSNLVVGDILPILLFIPIVILVLVALWNTAKAVRADYHHRVALNSVSQKGIDTYNNLILAERYNPYIDLYRTDLAQTNFALANAIAAQKGPSEASATGSLTDQDKANIQTLLSQSIAEARMAVALSPRSAQNLEILASIYRQISGVAQNALDFSLDSYGKAIQRDPFNPLLRLNVGGVYYSAKNYDLAIRFFTDSANLKPDYANAYYNLSIAARDKGDLRTAQAAAERVVQLLQKDTNSADYKTASSYLSDLKTKLASQEATGSAQVAGESQIVPPAAQENSALQKNELPNVVDLGQKPQVATPAAVKNTPRSSSRPTATPKATSTATP